MKAVVFTLGCKVNDVESGSLIRGLEKMGYSVSRFLDDGADLYIINTCAVTAEAERKSRQTVGKAVKAGKDAKIIVCGCASQRDPKQFFDKHENVVYVSGAQAKNRILEIVQQGLSVEKRMAEIGDCGKEYEEMLAPECLKSRAFVKIQDGCNRFCSYCIIPYLRGRSRSRSLESVKAEVLASTARETVLTGIDISDYRDENGHGFVDLLLALKDVSTRIRLGSLEVSLITDEFLDAAKQVKNFAPQFHLSLQSGSNSVLKSMNRHYTREEYLAACQKIYRAFPNASVTTDIIVGFPTETEEDFLQSVKIVEEAGFLQVHAFPYSPREGTVAYKKYKELPFALKKERVDVLLQKAAQVKEKYLSRFVGKMLSVVTEVSQDGFFEGYSENYIRVYVEDDGGQEPTQVRVERLYKDGVLARRAD
ncbi:MAG: tRNA (N(6)-L-threonylcarbamoyladenosine(37)-C(2))-methylthiotransferase MtaB [Clostridia bacterium]|nr:tRNA (N(6)-L-threonylcarbamoyladenosine(37)-C(2))-methylthiotransferase MtaB [Clostridia bacterium]